MSGLIFLSGILLMLLLLVRTRMLHWVLANLKPENPIARLPPDVGRHFGDARKTAMDKPDRKDRIRDADDTIHEKAP
jgi:hypothetical protein